MRDTLLHAIDLAILGDWEGAKAALQADDDPVCARFLMLMTRQQELDAERAERLMLMRHEFGNALSIAQANIEAMADGILGITTERLNNIRDALRSAGALLNEDRSAVPARVGSSTTEETFDACELVAAQISMLQAFAAAKHVTVAMNPSDSVALRVTGNPLDTAHLLRSALLDAVRITPPGRTITISCTGEMDQVTVRVRGGIAGRTWDLSLPLVPAR